MPVDFVNYSGVSNMGFKTKVQEDYILFNDRDFGEDILFACIADGAGSKDSMFRPGSIAAHQVEKSLKRIYKKDSDLFQEYSKIFLEEAFQSANNALIGFKLGDEAERIGFASALSCILLERSGILTFSHVGNTRIYLIRDASFYQLTKDHTEGQKLVDSGVITEENYYTAIERLRLYNGIGILDEPEVQTAKIRLKKNDVIIMTTDGIHYSYRPDAFFEILMKTETLDDAAREMVKTALDLRNYPDNISVNIVWYLGEEEQ